VRRSFEMSQHAVILIFGMALNCVAWWFAIPPVPMTPSLIIVLFAPST
jgi:hypothetical protein